MWLFIRNKIGKIILFFLGRGWFVILANSRAIAFEFNQYNSAKNFNCVDKFQRPIPYFTYPAVEYLDNHNLNGLKIFEYGSGSSTLYFLRKGALVTSIEHNKDWHFKVTKKANNSNSLNCILTEDKSSYINRAEILGADIVVIDGKYRTECTHYIIRMIEEKKLTFSMIIFDNSDWYPDSILKIDRSIRFYQASSSEMFGKVSQKFQNEGSSFYPRSPYAVAKVYAHMMTVNYREAYNMFCCNGILFNHESPLRGESFVTRKITMGLANIVKGKQNILELGNLESKRDWGFAGDYVEAMNLIINHKTPDDYVVSSGESHTVREFIERSCDYIGIDLVWRVLPQPLPLESYKRFGIFGSFRLQF
jgi:hypothetical protein